MQLPTNRAELWTGSEGGYKQERRREELRRDRRKISAVRAGALGSVLSSRAF